MTWSWLAFGSSDGQGGVGVRAGLEGGVQAVQQQRQMWAKVTNGLALSHEWVHVSTPALHPALLPACPLL